MRRGALRVENLDGASAPGIVPGSINSVSCTILTQRKHRGTSPKVCAKEAQAYLALAIGALSSCSRGMSVVQVTLLYHFLLRFSTLIYSVVP